MVAIHALPQAFAVAVLLARVSHNRFFCRITGIRFARKKSAVLTRTLDWVEEFEPPVCFHLLWSLKHYLGRADQVDDGRILSLIHI